MKAEKLIQLLSSHPDADVMVVDAEDPGDYDYLRVCEYFPESDRFHLSSPVVERKYK